MSDDNSLSGIAYPTGAIANAMEQNRLNAVAQNAGMLGAPGTVFEAYLAAQKEAMYRNQMNATNPAWVEKQAKPPVKYTEKTIGIFEVKAVTNGYIIHHFKQEGALADSYICTTLEELGSTMVGLMTAERLEK